MEDNQHHLHQDQVENIILAIRLLLMDLYMLIQMQLVLQEV